MNMLNVLNILNGCICYDFMSKLTKVTISKETISIIVAMVYIQEFREIDNKAPV